MKVLDRVVVLGGLLVLAVIGAGLVHAPATAPKPTGAVAGATPSALSEGVVGTVRTLDPLYATSGPERDIDALLFRGLTRLGPDGSVVADLARSWQIGSNGSVYTFTLREDARWHDGVAVTADDVVFTVLALQHPEYGRAPGAAWRGVVVERVDRLVVRFRLEAPAAGFLLVARQPIVPAHLLSGIPIGQREGSEFGRRPVGSGPFRLESLDEAGAELAAVHPTNDADRLTNPLHPEPAVPAPRREAIPQVERYRFRFYPNIAGAIAAFRAGAVDLVAGVSPDVAAALPTTAARTVRFPKTILTTVVLNLRPQQTTAFRDARIRRALLLAVDRKRLIERVLHGHATLAQTPISPASFAYDRKAAGSVGYSRGEAARLLRAAGWRRVSGGWMRPKGKRPVEFELSAVEARANPIANAVARQVAADWKRLGLKVTVRMYTTEQLAAQRLLPGRFFAAVVDVNLGLDPDLYPLLGSTEAVAGGTNLAGYQSRTLDAQLRVARAYADAATRKARFVALQRSVASELPILPLFFSDYLMVVRTSVAGPTSREIATPSDRYWDVLTWRLAEKPNG
jgi:peptide/nickel transport system substrate-binding protein